MAEQEIISNSSHLSRDRSKHMDNYRVLLLLVLQIGLSLIDDNVIENHWRKSDYLHTAEGTKDSF